MPHILASFEYDNDLPLFVKMCTLPLYKPHKMYPLQKYTNMKTHLMNKAFKPLCKHVYITQFVYYSRAEVSKCVPT